MRAAPQGRRIRKFWKSCGGRFGYRSDFLPCWPHLTAVAPAAVIRLLGGLSPCSDDIALRNPRWIKGAYTLTLIGFQAIALVVPDCCLTVKRPRGCLAGCAACGGSANPSSGSGGDSVGVADGAVDAFAITYFSSRRGPQSFWAYLLFGYIVTMLVNVLVPHVPSALVFRSYTPGVVTAVLINLPAMTY